MLGLEKTIRRLEARLGRIRELRIDNDLTQEEYFSERAATNDQLEQTKLALVKSRTLSESISKLVSEKLDLLEKAVSWEHMANVAKRAFLRSLSKDDFLTLEKADFHVDSVLAKLFTIGLALSSSQTEDLTLESVVIPDWCNNWDSIGTLENGSQSLDKPDFVVTVHLANASCGPTVEISMRRRPALTTRCAGKKLGPWPVKDASCP